MKVAVTTSTFAEFDSRPLDLLKQSNVEVSRNPYRRQLKQDEVINFCKEATGIIAGTETLDKPTLAKLANLKVISRCGAGLENVDLEAAKALGVKVFSTPDAVTVAVAELTVGLILNLIRGVTVMDRRMRENKWDKRMGNLLRSKQVGIIGFGRIGKKVAELLQSFGCEIVFTDPFQAEPASSFKRLTLEQLLQSSDIVTIHAATKELIFGKEQFAQMKRKAWLVNVSRGNMMDEEELVKHLENGHLAGAALDVFRQEPYQGPLTKFDNVVLTCHAGSYAKECRIEMELRAVENLLTAL